MHLDTGRTQFRSLASIPRRHRIEPECLPSTSRESCVDTPGPSSEVSLVCLYLRLIPPKWRLAGYESLPRQNTTCDHPRRSDRRLPTASQSSIFWRRRRSPTSADERAPPARRAPLLPNEVRSRAVVATFRRTSSSGASSAPVSRHLSLELPSLAQLGLSNKFLNQSLLSSPRYSAIGGFTCSPRCVGSPLLAKESRMGEWGLSPCHAKAVGMFLGFFP